MRGFSLVLAAGQGLEPQLPEPESGVLPLDDPAGIARDGSNPRSAADLPRVRRRRQASSLYTETRRFSFSVSMCAITSTYGSSPEPRSFALRRPSTWYSPDELFIRIPILT